MEDGGVDRRMVRARKVDRDLTGAHHRFLPGVFLVGVLAIVIGVVALGGRAEAAPALTIESTSWNVLGLDSNSWTTDGPDSFPVSARVCNVGTDPADNVAVDFAWESANSYVDLAGPATLGTPVIAAGDCADFYFNVVLSRDSAAFDTVRSYRIDATADGLGTISTATPREIFVERLVSQNRNTIDSITGPGGIGDPPATTVIVGQSYTYKLFSSTATQGYEQLEVFLDFPNIIFEVLSSDSVYSAPSGATNDTVYADACGWDPDPTSLTYLECVGPPNYGSGKAGGTIETTYVIRVVSAGNAQVTALIYDFSGSSFHYNSDFGVGVDSILITAVDADTDLSITKADSLDPVDAGAPLSYTLDVTNQGPADASNVSVVDTLPAGVTFQSASGPGWTCSEAAGTVTCDLAALSFGETSTVTIQVLAPATAGTFSNSVTVAADEADSDPSDNTATEDTSVVGSADLAITKSDSPDPVTVGASLTYTLDVTNAGPSTASSVQVTDPIPVGTTFVSATPSAGSCGFAGGIVTCDLGTVANGGAESVVVVVTPQPGSEGTILNVATVSSAVPDPDSVNNTASESTTINPSAGLSVTKIDVADPVTIGDDILYSIVVSNAGLSTATSVVLTDTLPAGATFVSATPTQGSCPAPAGGILTCNLGDLPAASTATVGVVITPVATGTHTNSVSVVSPTPDPNPGDNAAVETTEVETAADLRVSKSDSPDPVLVGSTLTYTITVANLGPSTATNVVVTDELPATVTFVSATPSQGSCNPLAGSTLTCDLGSILDGGNATVSVDVTPTAVGIILNTASAVSDDPDPTPGNNSAETTTVSPVATTDLVVTKLDDVDPVGVGEQVAYTINVTNVSAVDATGVDLEDTLPPFMTFVSAVPDQGSCSESGGVVSCLLGAIPAAPGPGNSVDVVVTLMPVHGGEGLTVTNTVEVGADQDDATIGDNAAAENTTIEARADLGVVKTDDVDPVQFGDSIRYTIVVTNNGPSDASNVQLLDVIAGASITSATPTQGGPCVIGGAGFTCALGDMPLGSAATIVVLANPTAAAPVTNDVTVSSDTQEPAGDPTPNSDGETTTVGAASNLAVTKLDDPDPVPVSSTLTYTIEVTNNGPSDATGVTAIDLLPPGTAFVSATPTQGSCGESGGLVTCLLGAIAAGNSATITIDLVPGPSSVGVITNSVSVSGDQPDTDPADNQAAADTTVTPVTDLEVTKTDGVAQVVAGTATTYSVTLSNNGPSALPAGAVVVDTIPAGTTGSETESDCVPGSGVITCTTSAPLAAGGSVSWDVSVAIPPSYGPGTVINSAAIFSSPLPDPNAANDTASDTDTVVAEADLAILKTDVDDPVMVGDDVFYTITIVNGGPSTADGVQVIDLLPANTVFLSAVPGQGSCGEAGGVVTCSIGSVDPGSSVIIDISVTAAPGTEGTMINTASVSAATTDPDPSDNVGTETTTVDPIADLEVLKVGPSSANAGEDAVYTVTVSNRGPSPATSVVLDDTLPIQLTFVSATPSQGACSESSGMVSCPLGSIATGSSAVVVVTAGVSVDAVSGNVVNAVSVRGAEVDPDSSNDADSAAMAVSGGGLPATGIPLDWFVAVGLSALALGALMILGSWWPHGTAMSASVTGVLAARFRSKPSVRPAFEVAGQGDVVDSIGLEVVLGNGSSPEPGRVAPDPWADAWTLPTAAELRAIGRIWRATSDRSRPRAAAIRNRFLRNR